MQYQKYFKILLYAWVLWVEYTFSASISGYSRKWVVETAYPDDTYYQCIQDITSLVSRNVEFSKNMPNVKRQEIHHLIGKREKVETEFKSGGYMYQQYVCLPDTVKPE